MSLPTHLARDDALHRAEAALRRAWPGWSGDLLPLKPLTKPLRATPFRVTGGPQPAVIKVWGPGNSDKAAAQAARQRAVAAQMVQGRWRVAPVLAFDAEHTTLLMADAGGPDLASAPMADLPATLADAGGWLRAYHDLSLRAHPFRPAGHLNWLNRLLREGRDGLRPIVDLTRFAVEVSALEAAAPALRGRPWARAVTHRDMTLSNLLCGPEGAIWGIDFENDREDEPLRDRFTLALDALCRVPEDGLHSAALSALTDGYGPGFEDGEIRLFLQKTFALGIWANTPAQPSQRQMARLQAAVTLLDAERAMI